MGVIKQDLSRLHGSFYRYIGEHFDNWVNNGLDKQFTKDMINGIKIFQDLIDNLENLAYEIDPNCTCTAKIDKMGRGQKYNFRKSQEFKGKCPIHYLDVDKKYRTYKPKKKGK